MGKQFCTGCGAALTGGMKFCEQCGAPVCQEDTDPILPLSPPAAAPALTPPSPSPGPSKKIPVALIVGVAVVLVIAAVLAVFILPGFSSGQSRTSGPVTPSATTAAPVATAVATTGTPVPDPFPNALRVKDGFPFGSGVVASEGTVYRVWINDTYQWHNDLDNHYYTQESRGGNKYLFIFVNVYNNGTMQVWPPASSQIKVYYDGRWYSMDPTHRLPGNSKNIRDSPIEIKEVQYFSKLYGSEYVEDFGYSHGDQIGFLYPGKSNAIDGYLIYEVPASLTPDKAIVQIPFNGNDVGVWRLG